LIARIHVAERDILQAIREALGLEPDLVLWRNSIGAGEFVERAKVVEAEAALRTGRIELAKTLLAEAVDNARYAKYGLPKGSADLIGILAPRGQWFALEVKAERGRLRPEQERWLILVRAMGGFATVVRSVTEARTALDMARKQLDTTGVSHVQT
jgi:hypothetical protein